MTPSSSRKPRSRSKKRFLLTPTKKLQIGRLTVTKNRGGLTEAIESEHNRDLQVCDYESECVQICSQPTNTDGGFETRYPVERHNHTFPEAAPLPDTHVSNLCDVTVSRGQRNHIHCDSPKPNSATEMSEEGEAILVQQRLFESTDDVPVDDEYPDPVGASLKQKEMRRLARLKQLEEFKAREMVEAREERYRRRQCGEAVQPKERHSKVKWRTDDGLVSIHRYSPDLGGDESAA